MEWKFSAFRSGKLKNNFFVPSLCVRIIMIIAIIWRINSVFFSINFSWFFLLVHSGLLACLPFSLQNLSKNLNQLTLTHTAKLCTYVWMLSVCCTCNAGCMNVLICISTGHRQKITKLTKKGIEKEKVKVLFYSE
jgi:hypothetical protein